MVSLSCHNYAETLRDDDDPSVFRQAAPCPSLCFPLVSISSIWTQTQLKKPFSDHSKQLGSYRRDFSFANTQLTKKILTESNS